MLYFTDKSGNFRKDKQLITKAEPASYTVPRSVGTAFSIFVLLGANSGALGVLLPTLSAYYGIDKATAGLLLVISTLGYLTGAFCGGFVVEKLGLRWFLGVGLAIFSLGCLTLFLSPPFGVLLAGRAMLGVGTGILENGGNLVVAALPRNTTLFNFLHGMYGGGAFLGPVLASAVLGAGLSWNNLYLGWLGLTLLLLTGLALWFPAHLRPPRTTEPPKTGAAKGLLRPTLQQRVVWLATGFLFFYVGVEICLGVWSYTFLTEERRYDTGLSSLAVSGYWLGLTLGRLSLAKLAEWRGLGNRGLVGGCLLAVGLGIGLLWTGGGEAWALASLLLIGFGLGPLYPTAIAALSGQVAERYLPTSMGIVSSLSILGATLFPWLTGQLAQNFGLGLLLPFSLALVAMMVGFWWFLFRVTKHFNNNQI